MSGRLRSRPTTAAANAVMMRNVERRSSTCRPSRARGGCPASAASEQPSAHAKLDSTAERAPLERGEVTVVDDGPHRDADARPEQQDAQADGERDRDHDVMNRCHVSTTSPMWNAVPLEERGQRVGVVLVPDHVRETDEREHQPDRDHELHDERLALQVAHDRAVEPDAEERGDHEHDERQRERAAANPWWTVSSQSTYARNMPIAPWAKLKMPVVV